MEVKNVAVSGTCTQTLEQEQENLPHSSTAATTTSEAKLVLRLNPGRAVRWEENVVNNEHMGKKSSKSA
jgi:hypothetical protein